MAGRARCAVERSSEKGSKSRPRLTYEELAKLAEDAGVSDLYDYAVASFDPLLKRRRTRSSIGFGALLEGSHKIVVSLVPGESSEEKGLRYLLYKNRFATLSGMSVEPVTSLMPAQHEDWTYEAGAGPDWEGFQGFIVSREEIDRLSAALREHRVE